MSKYFTFTGERFDLLKAYLTHPETSGQHYQFGKFLAGATTLYIYNSGICVYANNGQRLYFSNPVTHYQLGREFGNAVNYINEHCPPPKAQPIKALRRLLIGA